MNIKWALIALAAFGLLLIVALGLRQYTKTTPAAPVDTKLSPILAGTSTAGGDYHYVENQPYYTVDVTYPSQVPLPGSAATKAEKTIEQELANDIAQFKQDSNLLNLTAEDVRVQGLGGDRKYAFGTTYQKHESISTVSYVFTIYQDTLGAHPNDFYQTFTFDKDGNQLQLADLFKPGSNYLNILSPLAYAGVVAKLRSNGEVDPQSPVLDTVRIGTEPSPEALQFYYIDGNTLHLLFPPYQVAAYAAGSFDIAIPVSKLQNSLK